MLASKVPVAVGDVIAGKYRIDRVLGAGGMGVVVAAEHLQLRQIVAIKFVLPDALGSTEALERFLREARAVVRLRSEHVARVIDVGTLANGSPYMVMECLTGCTLGALLQRETLLPVSDVVHYVIQACEALAEAHSIGIVHRDLKPENLFLTHSVSGAPFVKVLDFGVSKMEPMTGEPGLTRTAALMGSPLYMAPEQMRSARDATARSDIWALGVVLYHLLGRRPPFDAESMPELCLKVTLEPPVPLRSRRADVPGALEGVIMRCLEKDPARRYANAAELASALEPFAPPEARAAVERARLIATGMRPAYASAPIDAAASSFEQGPMQPTSTPRSTAQDAEANAHAGAPRTGLRRYAGLAVAVASTALVVGLAVPLVIVYLERDERETGPVSTTTVQSASIAPELEESGPKLETTSATPVPPPEEPPPPSPFAPPFTPPPAPARDAAATRGAATDAGRQATLRARNTPERDASTDAATLATTATATTTATADAATTPSDAAATADAAVTPAAVDAEAPADAATNADAAAIADAAATPADASAPDPSPTPSTPFDEPR